MAREIRADRGEVRRLRPEVDLASVDALQLRRYRRQVERRLEPRQKTADRAEVIEVLRGATSAIRSGSRTGE